MPTERKILLGVIVAAVAVPIVWFAMWWRSPERMRDTLDGDGFHVDTGDTTDNEQPGNADVEPSLTEELPAGSEIIAEGVLESTGEEIAGTVQLIKSGTEYYVRLENFQIANGEDHYVYLSDRDELDGLENLGEVKANVGNYNFEVDDDVVVAAFEEVLIWNEATEQIVAVAELIRK